MDAFTAVFTTLTSSVAANVEAPRNEEAYGSGGGITYSCVIA
ncbi:hypothetical protein L202_06532 [Cryptococcus amylolentus CBS 6039]|uniref:Uncharacterized protein n=1 Tax=Cryptococcus amylolentus CBS 6039 TaxID=1295533 RepID=A0A1E3HG78_9TREE|nr:hypothetical protein L202_06518 [Cryptococcus amylolentus CBS 6039]XP_018991014.1 hypothetical protein L202_06532 [Cryptococcus amylolentus CBS 6039]ODN75342.1 hypothetical protein L202_06518 [Cryptococcus amylolentus CBS 6039]ODN75364.1 hypothetical protein L202_06532 [Cryptococcus amylolentus CBS 6039]